MLPPQLGQLKSADGGGVALGGGGVGFAGPGVALGGGGVGLAGPGGALGGGGVALWGPGGALGAGWPIEGGLTVPLARS